MTQRNTIKILIGIIILSLFAVHSYARIWANEGGCAGFDGGKSSCDPAKSTSIEYYIIRGANYLLLAHADIQKLLSEVEIMDIEGRDYNKLNKTLDSALSNIKRATIEYLKLKELADNTPYNQSFIVELVSFDYNKFQKERNLNKTIFDNVIGFLSYGDICGLFDKNLLNVQDLDKNIKEINEYIKEKKYPNNYSFWRLNQKFAESQLFGQYSSEVFYKISGK